MAKEAGLGQVAGDPVWNIVTDDAGPGIRIRHEGSSGNAFEVVGSKGSLWSIGHDGAVGGAFYAPAPSGDATGTSDRIVLQAIINAANGSPVLLGLGTYQLDTTLTVPAGVKLLGPGENLTTIKRVAAFGTVISVTGDNVTLEGFAVDGGLSSFATNANHGISAQNVNHFRARRLFITNYLNSAILVNATVSRTNFDALIEFCRCDGLAAANNGFLIVSYDRSGIRGCRAENIPGSPGYGCQIKNDSRWCFITDCDALSCVGGLVFGFDASTANGVIASRIVGGSAVSCGGGIVMGAASNNVVSGVDIWMTTNVNDAIRLQGKGDGTNGSVNNSITGVTVSGVGASRACVRFDDVSTDNVVTLDLVDASGATTVTCTGSSDRNEVEVKKYSNSAPAHELSNTSTGTLNRVRRVEDRPSLRDSAFGAITQNFTRDLPTVANAMTSQQPYYLPVYLQAGEVISNVTFHVSALTVAPTNFFVGLYRASSGLQVAVSADQSANVTTTGQKTLALTAPYVVLDSGIYYVAILNNGGTLSPLGLASSTAARLGSNPFPYAQDTNLQATLPGTLALSAGSKSLWVELS